MDTSALRTKIGLLGFIGLICGMSGVSAQSPPAPVCNFKFEGVCHPDQATAEAVMRAKDSTHALLVQNPVQSDPDNKIEYYIEPLTPLPQPSWHGTHYTSFQNPGFGGPAFATFAEALAFTIEKAGQTSEQFPDRIASDNLQFRGETNNNGLIQRYYSHDYPAIPIVSIDVTLTGPTSPFFRTCPNYAVGVAEANINPSFHFTYGPDETAPFNLQPNIVSFVFNNCLQADGDPLYRIVGFHVFHVSQIQGIFCNAPYTFDGFECVNPLTTIIEKGPFKKLETPPQPCPVSDRTDPCDAANGNKYDVETDYSTTAYGGLSFARYYNSKGPYKSAQEMAVGWRHSYSRRLDEQPDKNPLPKFVVPADQSQSYGTEEDACVFGWDDIKNTVWGGDLASATASYPGGNDCEISLGGSTAAYFPVRDAKSTGAFNPAPEIRTITRPNGSILQFQQSGAEWINLLNPALKLEQSGAEWIFTDTSDTRETYDSSGILLSITRRNGQTETLEYDLTAAQGGDDNSATLDRVTGAFGHTLIFVYDANGRLDSVTTPDGTLQYGYDSENNLNLASYPDLSTRQYLFENTDLPNHMTALIDENGDRFATWDYDDAGRAILSELANGQERIQLAYNADGTTTLTMSDGSLRTYDYSTQQGQRRVSTVRGDTCSDCTDGNIKDQAYDANGFASNIVDWNNNITNVVRDGRGLITTLIEAVGSPVERTTLTEWHAEFRLPTKITSSKNSIDLSHDTAGNILTWTTTGATEVRTWTFTYNTSGQPLTADGPRTEVTDVTTFTYYECSTGSECGQLQSVTNALGHVTSYNSYDASGRLLSMTDPNGLHTGFSYDARGRLLTVTRTPIVGTPRVTAMTYDDYGQVETVSTPDGQVLTNTYVAAHYLSSVSDNFGNRIDYDYDSMGNQTVANSRDPANILKRALAYSYDLNYRIDTVTDGGFVTDLTFDAVGNLTAQTDPKAANTQHNYDALNRLDDTIDALTGSINYSWDDHDNPTSITTANGVVTTYVYDDLDNRIMEVSPDRGQLTYTYDSAGNRISETDARGRLTSYTYDALNRLTLVTFDGGQTIGYQYDTGSNAIGRLNRITDASGQTDWSYDNFGEVIQKTQTIGTAALTTGYSYDSNGRLSTMTLPSGKVVTYGYNAYQQDSVSVDGQTILSGARYDPFGPVNAWTWGNGSFASRSFDLRGLMDSVALAGDTRTIGYDPAGQLTSALDTSIDVTYDYDLLGRLTDFTNNDVGGGGAGTIFSSPPVLLASIQTMKNEIGDIPNEPSAPWLTVATKNVTATSAKVSLERGQVNTGSIDVKEKIGYLAIEVGSGSSFVDSGGNTITYEAQITPEIIKGWDTGCFKTNFLNVYSSKPVVMASLNSHNGGDGGWLRRCSLNKTALGLTVDEDKFGDPERMHNNAESAGIVAFSAAFDAQFTDSNGSWGMEIAKVTLPSTATLPTFTSITFRQAYETKPVVLVLPNKSGNNPASVRIRNVSKTGFEVVQVEPAPENGTHNSMPIHYLAIEPGIHTLPDGTKLEVGRKSTKKQKHGSGVVGNEGWATVNFSSGQPTLVSQTFTYDANGNRSTLTEESTLYSYAYAFDSNRVLSAPGPVSKMYSYDAAGNVTSDGVHTYGYDDRNRLTSVDSGLVTYQHNGQGQRVTKDDGTETLFANDEAGMLVGEYDSLGVAIQETVYFQGAPVAVLDGANVYFVHTDQLGTPRVITDDNTVIWRWESDPFGSTIAQEDPDGDQTLFTYNLRFSGQYFDNETEFHYNYFRTYDPSTGRYVESDPIGLAGGLNTYGYVGGNPLLFSDPFGLVKESDCIHFFIRKDRTTATERRRTVLRSFNWPGMRLNVVMDIDLDPRGRRAPRPGIGFPPVEFFVDQVHTFRFDVFEVSTVADIMEARCHTVIKDECTGAQKEFSQGSEQYRANEEVTEKFLYSYEDFTRTRILTIP